MSSKTLSTRGEISRQLVRLSFFLNDSDRYQRVKSWFRELLEDVHSPYKKRFDLTIIALVLISVGLLMYGVQNRLGPIASLFEVLAVAVFVVEYLLRFWVSSDVHRVIIEHYERAEFLDRSFRPWPALWEAIRGKLRYMTSPLAVIDLLAILPSYRSVRLLRVFMLFRLFKLFRYTRSVNILAQVMAEKRFEFYTLFLFTGFMVLVGSSAIYLFEGDLPHSGVTTLFDAVYWTVVTLSTVGYGDITPVTDEGRMVAMVIIASGIGVFAFATSLIVSALQGKLGEMREHRVFSELERREGYTVVCGYGRVGQSVVERLAQVRERFVIIEKDPEQVQQAVAKGYLVVAGDAANAGLMDRIGLATRAATVLCITGDDVTNVFVTVSARALNPDLRIIARANRREVVRKLTLAGANQVVAPFQAVGMVGAEYVGRPVAFETFHSIVTGTRGVVLDGVRIPVGSEAAGQTLAELGLANCKLVLFGIISRREHPADQCQAHTYELSNGHFYYNPPPAFILQERDMLVVFGHEYSVLRFRRQIEVNRGRRL